MGGRFEFSYSEPREAFLTEPGGSSKLVPEAVERVTGILPKLSASGGTSDARFIKDHCPVVEFGPTGATIHQVDESDRNRRARAAESGLSGSARGIFRTGVVDTQKIKPVRGRDGAAGGTVAAPGVRCFTIAQAAICPRPRASANPPWSAPDCEGTSGRRR